MTARVLVCEKHKKHIESIIRSSSNQYVSDLRVSTYQSSCSDLKVYEEVRKCICDTEDKGQCIVLTCENASLQVKNLPLEQFKVLVICDTWENLGSIIETRLLNLIYEFRIDQLQVENLVAISNSRTCEKMKEKKEVLRRITNAIDNCSEAITIHDITGQCLYVNPAFFALYELTSETINFYEILDHEIREELQCVLLDGKSFRKEVILTKKDSTKVCVSLTMDPVKDEDQVITGWVGIYEDLTGLKRLQKDINRLELINLIGEMAAGIAHEVRNPMTTVKGYLQYLESKPEMTQYHDQFKIMIREMERANHIISEYLSLAKDRVIEPKRRNLNFIIAAILPHILANSTLSEKKVELHLGEAAEVYVDEKEIRQLLHQLIKNALEAIQPGQTVHISTSVHENNVILGIIDQGTGISPESLEKIGTPFFTTKDNGTGLGLAKCYSILARHQAKMDIVSGSDGTRITVKFPQKQGEIRSSVDCILSK